VREHESKDMIPVTVVNMQWKRIPENNKQKILSNVLCSSCRDVISVTDYKIENHDLGFIINGKCSVCGSEVARVVEKE
jgi:hypothetical protein